MKKTIRQFLCICLILLLLCFAGCAADPDGAVTTNVSPETTTPATEPPVSVTEQQAPTDSEEPVVLRVVTPMPSAWSPMFPTATRYDMVGTVVSGFGESYSNVQVELTYIPTDEMERQAMLHQIQSDMLMGEGPDVFILNTFGEASSLIPDVRQAMENGLFMDISEYYNADVELEKESLHPGVMDAGVLEGCRYVLPLGYDFPVAYVDMTKISEAGYDLSVLLGGMPELLKTVANSLDDVLAQNVSAQLPEGYLLNYFSSVLDYDVDAVTLDEGELSAFLSDWRSMRTLADGNSSGIEEGVYSLTAYADRERPADWCDNYFLRISTASNAVYFAGLAKLKGIDLAMIPLTAADGTLTANVSWYGGVSAECRYPELAYELLRTFLTEDIQHTQNAWAGAVLVQEQLCWPVRYRDAATEIWTFMYPEQLTRNDFGQGSAAEEQWERAQQLNMLRFSDTDIPVVEAEIGYVRFPSPEITELAEELLDNVENADSEDVVSSLAAEFIQNLQACMAKG